MARQLTRREFLGAALVAGGTVLALATRGDGRPAEAKAVQVENVRDGIPVEKCEELVTVKVHCSPYTDLGNYALYSTTGGREEIFLNGKIGVGWSILKRTPENDISCNDYLNEAKYAYTGGARVCPVGIAPVR